MPTNVAVFVWPNMTMIDSIAPHQILGLLPDMNVYTFSKTAEPIKGDTGLTLTPDYDLDNLPTPDVLVVGGGANPLSQMEDPVVIEGIRKAGENAQWITSVCTGSLILAQAGLLDGYKAACHWAYKDLLRQYPLVEVTDGRVVVDRNRVTGGGITAGVDFGMTLAGKLLGDEAGMAAELIFEYQPEPPYGTGSPGTAPEPIMAFVGQLLGPYLEGLPEFVAAQAH